MDKRSEFNAALKEALKKQDKIVIATVRLIISALKEKDINARGEGKEALSESEILGLLQTMVKQRQESVKAYSDAGRTDLVDQEEQEIKVIRSFMPQQLSDAEVDQVVATLIAETGAKDIKDMGKVMALIKTRYAGQVDMGKIGGVLKGKLG